MATIYSWTAIHCICIQFHQETQTHKTGFSEHFTVLFCLNVNLYVDPECFLLFNWLSSFVRKATVTSWQPCLCFFTEKIKNNQQYFSRECFWIQASHIHNHLGNRHNLSRHMTEKVCEPLFSPPQALFAVVIGQYCVAFLKKFQPELYEYIWVNTELLRMIHGAFFHSSPSVRELVSTTNGHLFTHLISLLLVNVCRCQGPLLNRYSGGHLQMHVLTHRKH